MSGFANEPVAHALLASGVKIFGRSIKYHRPRGPLCLHGHCSGCLVRIDGVPNMRACEVLCRSGMTVERQAGWPGTGFDVLRTVDWLAPDTLEHHGMFTASTLLNRLAARFIRKLSGQGEPPTADRPAAVQFQSFLAPVVVIGAGVSGLSAAITLAGCGHKVLLLERERTLGGRLQDGTSLAGPTDNESEALPGWDLLASRKQQLMETEDVEIHSGTPVLSVYPEDPFQVLASNESETFEIKANRLVICTGTYDQLPLFENNDLPGLFSLRALDRLVCGHGIVPAEPVVLVGDSDECLRLALLLAQAPVKMAGVVTQNRNSPLIEILKRHDVPLFFDRSPVRARGGKWLSRLEFESPSATGSARENLVLDCQTAALEALPAPAYELAHHAGCRVTFSSRSGYQVAVGPDGRSSHSQIFAAGSCTGPASLADAIRQGEMAGLACALSLKADPEVAKRLKALSSTA